MLESSDTERERRPPKVVFAVSVFILILFVPFLMSGGDGVALLVFILSCLGILGLIAHKAWKQRPPLWFLALALFLTWAWVSQFWSAYPKVEGFSNAEKLLIMGLMFPATVWLWQQMRDHILGRPLRKVLIAVLSLTILLLFVEAMFGYRLSYLIKPLQSQNDLYARNQSNVQNTGRGLIFCAVMMPVVLALLWQNMKGRIFTFILMILISVTAIKLNLAIAMFVHWVALGFGLLACLKPRVFSYLVAALAVYAILFAPLIVVLMSFLSESQTTALPSSFEHRFLMWKYSLSRILEAPIIGHGFDSARTFTDTITLSKGYELPVISMHTHNAGLQIWLETGLIGALLASGIIVLLLKPLQRFAQIAAAQTVGLIGFLMGFILVSLVSFGVWQFWWWATLCFAIACLNLVRISPSSEN